MTTHIAAQSAKHGTRWLILACVGDIDKRVLRRLCWAFGTSLLLHVGAISFGLLAVHHYGAVAPGAAEANGLFLQAVLSPSKQAVVEAPVPIATSSPAADGDSEPGVSVVQTDVDVRTVVPAKENRRETGAGRSTQVVEAAHGAPRYYSGSELTQAPEMLGVLQVDFPLPMGSVERPTGQVVAQVAISDRGLVERVVALHSTLPAVYDTLIISALKAMPYRAGRVDSHPVPSIIDIEVSVDKIDDEGVPHLLLQPR